MVADLVADIDQRHAGDQGARPSRRELLAAADAGIGALLLTPGPDLRYVTGYDAMPLERLTCLVAPAADAPFMVVPRLELAAAEASPAGGLDLDYHVPAESRSGSP